MVDVDVLRHIHFEIPCTVCAGSYLISAETVRESQRLLAAGCPSAWSEECPPVHYAALAPPQTLAQLSAALETLERAALRSGVKSVRVAGPGRSAPADAVGPLRQQREAIARWEDEGGAAATDPWTGRSS